MFSNKTLPVITLSRLKLRSEFPVIVPGDSKSYAKFIQYGELAETIKCQIRNMSWYIHEEKFCVTKNKEIVSGCFLIELPTRTPPPGCMYALGFVYGFGRRHRLRFYAGLWNREEKYPIIPKIMKAKKMGLNVSVSEEAGRMVADFAATTKNYFSLGTSIMDNTVEDPRIHSFIMCESGIIKFSRLPMVLDGIGKRRKITKAEFLLLMYKAIIKSPEWMQMGQAHRAYSYIQELK